MSWWQHPVQNWSTYWCTNSANINIELFLATIRASGGWNNKLTTIQFSSVYKKLHMCHMIEGSHSNCIIQGNTKLLPSVDDQWNVNSVQTGVADMSIARRFDLDLWQINVDDHCQLPNDIQISEYKDAVISHVADFVVKMVAKKLVLLNLSLLLPLS